VNRPVVVNTRLAEQAGDLSSRLRGEGFDPLEAPAIELAAAWDRQQVEASVTALMERRLGWVVVASASAAQFLLRALADVGATPEILAGTTVLCSTRAAAVLRAAGVSTIREIQAFSARHALEVILEDGARSVVLAPRAADGRDEMLAGLRTAGREVMDVPLYATRAIDPARLAPAADAMQMGKVAVVTFASPSAVSAFTGGMRAHGIDLTGMGIPAVHIGQSTAAAAAAQGWRSGAVALEPTVDAMVAAVRSVVSSGTKIAA
jgi:uroporphyrinogen-III synthase